LSLKYINGGYFKNRIARIHTFLGEELGLQDSLVRGSSCKREVNKLFVTVITGTSWKILHMWALS